MNTYTTHSNDSSFDVGAGQTFTVYDYEARNRLRRYRQNRALSYLRALIHCLSRLTLSCRFFFLYFILYSFSPSSSNWIGHWWPGQYCCRKELYIKYIYVYVQNYCINSERIRRKKKNKSKNKHQKEMEGSIQFSRYSVLSMRIYSQKGLKK